MLLLLISYFKIRIFKKPFSNQTNTNEAHQLTLLLTKLTSVVETGENLKTYQDKKGNILLD